MGSGLMSTDKLPEWPERMPYHRITNTLYWQETAAAALARMEALVKYAEHHHDCFAGPDCTCGLSELLAACERRKS